MFTGRLSSTSSHVCYDRKIRVNCSIGKTTDGKLDKIKTNEYTFWTFFFCPPTPDVPLYNFRVVGRYRVVYVAWSSPPQIREDEPLTRGELGYSDMADSPVDLGTVPLVALNVTVRKHLGLYLNPRNAVAADWTAVAEAMGFSYLEIQNYAASRNPTLSVLENWQTGPEATVGKLLSILQEVERKDIVEDLSPMIGLLELFCTNVHLKKTKQYFFL